MQCAACDRVIPNDGVICPWCNPADARTAARDGASATHLELAATVRRLKGYVVASVIFGIFIAPFAIAIASGALRRFASLKDVEPATFRQLVLMRRIAFGLMFFWAILFGVRLGAIMQLYLAE